MTASSRGAACETARVPRRARPEQITFSSVDHAGVVAAVEELVTARTGWANLLPEIPEQEQPLVERSLISSWMRASGPPVPMATFVAPLSKRGERRPASIGLEHGAGAGAIRRLAEGGLEVPGGWKVVQDHIRRGVVLSVPEPIDVASTISWIVEAVALLCPVPVTGQWLAEVHAG